MSLDPVKPHPIVEQFFVNLFAEMLLLCCCSALGSNGIRKKASFECKGTDMYSGDNNVREQRPVSVRFEASVRVERRHR